MTEHSIGGGEVQMWIPVGYGTEAPRQAHHARHRVGLAQGGAHVTLQWYR